MFSEVVILAGGLGTRLRSEIGTNLPKPMAPVSGKPFLTYIMDRLAAAGAKRVLLAVGYHHEVIEAYFGTKYRSMEVVYSCEESPLGTGGAIRQAAEKAESEDFPVLNGDTLFDLDWAAFYAFHTEHKAPISVALREVEDTARYGSVETDGAVLTAFREKAESTGRGLINGGVYAVNRAWLLQQKLPEKFSFERDVLQAMVSQRLFCGKAFADYFVDMGIPADYQRAKREIAQRFPADRFLFLDRDGVLNERIAGDYVRRWAQWKWLPGAKEAVARLTKAYERAFVVSNQQGIGKGLMTEADVAEIHDRMSKEIAAAGGHIDAIYVCPSLAAENDPNRKPKTGMARQAVADFPEVCLHNSVMIGDSVSDMEFGWRCGMRCVYLTNGEPIPDEVSDCTDLCYERMSTTFVH